MAALTNKSLNHLSFSGAIYIRYTILPAQLRAPVSSDSVGGGFAAGKNIEEIPGERARGELVENQNPSATTTERTVMSLRPTDRNEIPVI